MKIAAKSRWALLIIVAASAIVGGVINLRARAATPVWEPTRAVNYHSTREIRQLEIAADGALWARTTGGDLRFQSGKWSRAATPHAFGAAPLVRWRGQRVSFDFDGLRIGDGARLVAMPLSSGSHISAVLARGEALWVAIFGDGIWQWDGALWTKPPLNLPDPARQITALALANDGTIWLGTRRAGVWSARGGVWNWQQHLQSDEPFAANVQALQSYGGALWASTLEDGLIARDARGWRHYGKGALSSNAPRQMAVFAGRLYVRHSNERVDCFDGKTWARDVFPSLPRRQILSIAADEKRLYLGQWGGWSEWDGQNWTHHLRLPELQIVPLLQIFPDENGRLWLGTENRGLFEWDARAQKLRHFDERDGLPDDWITAIARSGNRVFAGTFQGGLAWREDGENRWNSSSWKSGVSALATAGDQTFIATRFGLYRQTSTGALEVSTLPLAPDEREIQALLPAPHGLWIGTRDALLFRPFASGVS